MKKIVAILLVLLVTGAFVFANTPSGAIKDFANNAANKGNGTSYLSVQYDFFIKDFGINGQFGLVGPWGCEIGFSIGDESTINMDLLSFTWSKWLKENVFLNFGFGMPINMYLGFNYIEELWGINPHAKFEINFINRNGNGVVIYARPGYRISNLVTGFSLPIGVGFRMPGDILASLF